MVYLSIHLVDFYCKLPGIYIYASPMDPMGNKNLRVVCFPEFDGRTAPHPAAMKLIEAVVT